jgi:hypothetical protein
MRMTSGVEYFLAKKNKSTLLKEEAKNKRRRKKEGNGNLSEEGKNKST